MQLIIFDADPDFLFDVDADPDADQVTKRILADPVPQHCS
jgi:hypothetical protein